GRSHEECIRTCFASGYTRGGFMFFVCLGEDVRGLCVCVSVCVCVCVCVCWERERNRKRKLVYVHMSDKSDLGAIIPVLETLIFSLRSSHQFSPDLFASN